MVKEIRFIEVYGGIGGFTLGLQRASKKFKCVWYCDNYEPAVQIYNKQFKEEWKPTDIKDVDENSIPDHDILCAGFPCPTFSMAGRRQGFEDSRGSLFFEICRIAKAKRPRLLFLENVQGLLSADAGRVFHTILLSLDELGYDTEWQNINTKYWLPQNRARVFIIGHIRDGDSRQVFPIGEGSGKPDGMEQTAGNGGTGLENEISSTIDSNYWKGGRAGRSMIIVHNIYGGFKENKMREFEHYSPTIRTPQGGGHLPMVMDKEGRIRKLTPRECERLQGFPDDYTQFGADGKKLSDTKRYMVIGNAVSVPVIVDIGKRIVDVIKDD